MGEIKLKPCPFCRCDDRRVSVRKMGKKGYRVVCARCGASGPYVAIEDCGGNKSLTQMKVAIAWNKRAGQEGEAE